jgi:cytochrome c2
MRYVCLMTVVALAVLCTARPAAAVVQFYVEYKKAYLDTHPDKEYAAAVNKASDRCFVCHQGKNRKNHNEFGIHLVELLDRKKDIRDK